MTVLEVYNLLGNDESPDGFSPLIFLQISSYIDSAQWGTFFYHWFSVYLTVSGGLN